MDFFAILRSVIEANVGQLCDQNNLVRAAVCANIQSHLDQMQTEYFSGKPNIPYQNPICRLAYLFRHVAVGADLCEQGIMLQPQLRQHLTACAQNNRTIRVCAFGGGPGTEQLALCSWLEKDRPVPQVVRVLCSVVDRVAEWADSLKSIDKAVEDYFGTTYGSDFANWPALPQSYFFDVDVTQTQNFANLPQLFSDQDLYILNYVVSEMEGQENAFTGALSYLSSAASSGAYFLFIDRAEAKIESLLDKTAAACGLTSSGRTELLDYVLSGSHQKESLGAILGEVARQPRLQANAFVRTYIKAGL